MKALFTASIVALFIVIVGGNVLRVYLNDQTKAANAEAHKVLEAANDSRLSAACDAGSTGVVLFYKGKDCSK
jgi:cytochrome b subunit of formate dehydrogenase